MLALERSPYLVAPETEASFFDQIRLLEERVRLLRGGALTEATLRRYYQNSRLRDVTESMAIEGSTLDLRETELAVLQGMTLTGHDPGYVRDARTLFAAFERLAELATLRGPTDLGQVKEIHELIFGDRPGAGLFRSEPVRISGALHVPPPTWAEVMKGMEQWEAWSLASASVPALLRATVLHAWLAHIHPFTDGNGRTARSITTLELVRAGFPPLIVRKKDRKRYYDALAAADQGDLAPFLDLLLARGGDALRELERAATAAQGYSPAVALLRKKLESQREIWNRAVGLLLANLGHETDLLADAGTQSSLRSYASDLDPDDYLDLCDNRPVSEAWAFEIDLTVPGSAGVVRLAWIGFRSPEMIRALGSEGAAGPTLFWSVPNPAGTVPRWRLAGAAESPGGEEMTFFKDQWVIRKGLKIARMGTAELAASIARDLVALG
jgi:Fic family protein